MERVQEEEEQCSFQGVICCLWAELDRKGLERERLPEQGCKAAAPTASNGLQKRVGSRRPVCTCNSGLRPGVAELCIVDADGTS